MKKSEDYSCMTWSQITQKVQEELTDALVKESARRAKRELLNELKFNMDVATANKEPFNIYHEICVRLENLRKTGEF